MSVICLPIPKYQVNNWNMCSIVFFEAHGICTDCIIKDFPLTHYQKPQLTIYEVLLLYCTVNGALIKNFP